MATINDKMYTNKQAGGPGPGAACKSIADLIMATVGGPSKTSGSINDVLRYSRYPKSGSYTVNDAIYYAKKPAGPNASPPASINDLLYVTGG